MSPIEHPLDFERPLVELEYQLERLKDELASGNQSRRAEYAALETKVSKIRKEIYSKLTPYQRVQLSRHFDRPFTLDYIKFIFSDFIELHGDRLFRDDPAIVGGTARLGEVPIMIIGHQRGRTTAERLKRNFGMANPEGYRKAMRLMRLAEKSELTVPIISVVIGEGGSGGALALGVSDRILMLENACYSVITPEGCASILWHSAGKTEVSTEQASLAAEALNVTAQDLKRLNLIDEIVPEPSGGAHSNHKEAAEILRAALVRNLDPLSKLTVKDLVAQRYEKFRRIGPFVG